MAKCNSGTSSGVSSGTSSKNLSRVMILVLHPYSICLGFRYSRAGCDFKVINFKLDSKLTGHTFPYSDSGHS